MSLVSKAVEIIRKYDLFHPGAHLLVGISGGPDSVALLHVLHEIARPWKLRLQAVHVNHQLRGRESEEDELFVQKLCAHLGIKLTCKRINPRTLKSKQGGSLEDICRNERYRVFLKLASRTHVRHLVLAHHKNDLAETVLMRLVRGAGSSGLSGFAPKTRFDNVFVVRPFYAISRDEILSYLKEKGIVWRVDSSNKDRRFLRNKIRLQLIPYLQRHFNPKIVEALARTAQLLQEDDSALTAQTERLYANIIKKNGANFLSLPLKRLRALAPYALHRLLHFTLTKFSRVHLPPEMEVVSNLTRLVKAKKSGEVLRLPDDVIAYCSYNQLLLIRISLPRSISKRALLDRIAPYVGEHAAVPQIPMRRVLRIRFSDLTQGGKCANTINDLAITAERRHLTPRLRKRIFERRRGDSCVEYFDLAALRFPLSIRTRRDGDIFHPFGARGRRKLKDFLIDQKIPVHLRSTIPLLCHGKTVLWIIGHRRSDAGKIGATTREVLKVEFTPAT